MSAWPAPSHSGPRLARKRRRQASAAGDSAAATLRAEGYGGPITIVDPDTDAPYDRPNCSKDYLAGSAPEEWLPLRSPDWDRDHGIERLRGRRVAALRPADRRAGTAPSFESRPRDLSIDVPEFVPGR